MNNYKYSLHNGNCLEIMPQFPNESFELILTDPPYNVSAEGARINRGRGKYSEGKDIILDFGEWDKGQITWQDFILEFERLLTPHGVLVLFYERMQLGTIGVYLQSRNWQVRHIGCWVKSNPTPQARKVKWQNGTEMFLVATRNKGTGHHFNYQLGQSPDYLICPVNIPHRIHPTQKPLKLIEWIISYWSYENDRVLDPFMGSGTTGVACLQLNRYFVGIEQDEKIFEQAENRLKSVNPQLNMTTANYSTPKLDIINKNQITSKRS